MSLDIAVTNEPVVLFVLPGGAEVKARALPIARAHAWLKRAFALAAEVDAIGNLERGEQIESALDLMMERVYSLVLEYDPTWDREALMNEASPGQLANAYYTLMELNSPFAALGRRRLAAIEEAANAVRGAMRTSGGSASVTSTR